jgi:hypothetical protein
MKTKDNSNKGWGEFDDIAFAANPTENVEDGLYWRWTDEAKEVIGRFLDRKIQTAKREAEQEFRKTLNSGRKMYLLGKKEGAEEFAEKIIEFMYDDDFPMQRKDTLSSFIGRLLKEEGE